jgi:UMF1 family MFS transporter
MTASPGTQPPATTASRPTKSTSRELWAWACYDWANSAYSTLSITFLAGYITNIVLPGDAGTIAWSFGIGASMFVAALLSPMLGALADAHASKRGWLAATAFGGAAAAVLLGIVPPIPALVVALFLAAHILFELSFGFYNGFLPELADESQLNRVSSWGFAAGYIGGGLALALALVVFQFGAQFGLESPETRIRLNLVIMGTWWGLFSIPTVLVLRDRCVARKSSTSLTVAAREAFGEVWHTLRNVRKYRTLSIFLAGYLLYNEGINTVLTQASLFANKALKMDTGELAFVVLLIQFAAFPGALLVGWLADRWGQKPALMLCLAGWTALLVAAYFVTTKAQFWGLAGFLALIMGGTQSVSRSIMGYMTPEAHTAEFMGFFSLSQKATSMVGPLLFGTILVQTGSAHTAILSLIGFILIGWAVVSRIDLQRGRSEALNG